MQPLNIRLMDVGKVITERGLLEVTSPLIHSSSSSEMNPEGLFSETIFGPLASEERMLRHGFIRLNCRVFHPVIFQNLQSMKKFYVEIMAGREYATWDKTEKEFVRAAETDPGAGTGYAFFLKYWKQINFKKNRSLRREDKINILINNQDKALIEYCLVIPAGIRDIKEDEGRLEKGSINSLYTSLLSSCKAMPPFGDNDPLYDTVHWSIQRKIMEVYECLFDMMEGKRGFLQGKLAYRHVVGGTRNVITATNMEASEPDSPQAHKPDEVKVPLFQCAKGYSSLVIYWLRLLFYSNIIGPGSEAVPLIDPQTNLLGYVPIDDKDRDLMSTGDGIQKTIDRFRDPSFRFKPAIARSKGKPYYLYLVYDDGDKIYMFRNVNEFKQDYDGTFDEKKLRPMTYIEMLYIATYYASKGRYGLITRYPVTDQQSIFPAKTHLMSTAPARIVTLVANAATKEGEMLPEYPILGKTVEDVLKFHPSRRAGLGADYDGDTVSWNPIYGDEANEECAKYCDSPQNFILPSGKSQIGTDDLCSITVHALTADPPANSF